MTDIREKLIALTDEGNKRFLAKLIPNIPPETILGIKSPILRTFIKREFTLPDEKRAYLAQPHYYLEEKLIHASLLASFSNDIEEILRETENFLPQIDNWAVNDSTVSALKIFKKHPARVRERCQDWLNSSQPYTLRFAVITLLCYFLDDSFNATDITRIASIKSDDYYVNMGIAWYLSAALAKQFHATIRLFETKTLPSFIQNKSIQKAIESLRVPEETKTYLRTLKI